MCHARISPIAIGAIPPSTRPVRCRKLCMSTAHPDNQAVNETLYLKNGQGWSGGAEEINDPIGNFSHRLDDIRRFSPNSQRPVIFVWDQIDILMQTIQTIVS
jgi:hypothetical protein